MENDLSAAVEFLLENPLPVLGALVVAAALLRFAVCRIRIPSTLTAKVIKVYDGDTIRVRTFLHGKFRVRLAFMDAPEGEQEDGEESTALLKHLVDGRRVRLQVVDLDYYGRYVCRVYASQRDISLAMIEAGLAYVYKPYLSKLPQAERGTYWRAQAQARERRLGVWRREKRQMPWDWRWERRSIFARMIFALRRIWRRISLFLFH